MQPTDVNFCKSIYKVLSKHMNYTPDKVLLFLKIATIDFKKN